MVSRLISFCMRKDLMSLEEVHDAETLARDRYDVVFVDEASYTEKAEGILARLSIRKKVFLSSSAEVGKEGRFFDAMIKKPFLPSQITTVLEGLQEDDALEVFEKTTFLFPLSGDETNVGKVQDVEEAEEVDDVEADQMSQGLKAGTSVLDSNEIERIKALLDMKEEDGIVNEEELESRKVEAIKQQLIADGVEIAEADEYAEALSKKPLIKEPLVKEKDQPKKKKKSAQKAFTFEEALLAAVSKMKVKKIKKLLKGAEVTIKINFKDGK